MAISYLSQLGTLNYSKQENIILNYIVENKDEVIMMSCEKMAQSCYTSTASIIRFCQKHNINGFSELKGILKVELQNSQYRLSEKSINNNEEEIKQFIKFIDDDKPVFLFGKGASYICALYLFRQLIKIQKNIILINDQGLLLELKNKKIVVISNSGENLSSLNLIDNSNKIAGICASNSTLDKMSKVSLTHNQNVNLLDKIEKEQQIHLLEIVNELINKMR